jgi:hypothetical protein
MEQIPFDSAQGRPSPLKRIRNDKVDGSGFGMTNGGSTHLDLSAGGRGRPPHMRFPALRNGEYSLAGEGARPTCGSTALRNGEYSLAGR